jgi:predicted butyrate kinase (DUF1464 family)
MLDFGMLGCSSRALLVACLAGGGYSDIVEMLELFLVAGRHMKIQVEVEKLIVGLHSWVFI